MDGWLFLSLVFVVVFTTSGFVQSTMGFGYAMVALAVLPYFMDIRLGNLIVSLSMLVPMLYTTLTYRRQIQPLPLVSSLAGAAIGLPIGLIAFAFVDPNWLVRGTGVVILLTVLDGVHRGRRRTALRTPSKAWSLSAGLASGFLSGSVGIGGPPVAAYASRQPWSPGEFKAFVLSFSLAVVTLRVIGLFVTGFLSRDVLLFSAAAVPFGYLGAWLGAVASKRINARRFRQLTFTLLAFSSVGMIIHGRPHTAPASVTRTHLNRSHEANAPAPVGLTRMAAPRRSTNGVQAGGGGRVPRVASSLAGVPKRSCRPPIR
ncbi:MAG: sulfite exporter TauE/SafE family protein [Pirellulaceae bacterium]